MPLLPPDLYERWRNEAPGFVALREVGDDDPPSERLLQRIWLHQRLQREGLTSTQGDRITVFHPGFWNHEAGPDFREAVVQVENGPPGVGDIEVDLFPEGWHQHGHRGNPEYERVRLHVVWDARRQDPPRSALPTLELRHRLDAPLSELRAWFAGEPELLPPVDQRGKCEAPLSGTGTERLEELLRQAARLRLVAKASRLSARAKAAGWEQALWEEIFAALGYKQNSWPMRRLGELRSRLIASDGSEPASPRLLQARLLGIGNLLPAEFSGYGAPARRYLREAWDFWWRERDAFLEEVLPRQAWRFSSVRPANHPQRRLALAAHWLTDAQWPKRLEAWLREDLAPERLLPSLMETLPSARDTFWSRHWTFRSAALAEPRPLIGPSRVTDLAVNVFLPWFWSRARSGRNQTLRKRAEQRYFDWPAMQDNTVLRRARQRLLGGGRHQLPRRAAMQQGLIQIVRDFCEHSNALCVDCRFPNLIAELD